VVQPAKEAFGRFWEGRYHSTMIEEGPHLWRCLIYIELNMVRAGVVKHPEQWRWCSYAEWMNHRQRYGIVNKAAGLAILGGTELACFQTNYRRSIDEMIVQDRCRREPSWTESIAVGSPSFLAQLQREIRWRRRFEMEQLSPESWVLREISPAWTCLNQEMQAQNCI
jgi:putative transposase